jgi:serine/threonine protein phosphatase PrpC
MRWEQKIQFATLTDVGLRRQNNEDSACVIIAANEDDFHGHGHLLLVADGMGGHAVGELASKIAAEVVPHTYLKHPEGDVRIALQAALTQANNAIHTRGEQNRDFQRMGTTCSTLVLSANGAYVGHVGDSRVYRVRRDRVDQLSFDHSLHWELQRKDHKLAKQIDLSAHKNVITRCLGPEPSVMVDLEGPHPILPGDVYLLCSDGLSNQVDDEEIGAIVRELSPAAASRLLVNLANARGGPDNSTVIVAKVGDLPANVPPPPLPEEPARPGLGWAWVGAFWAVAMLLVWGLWLMYSGRPWPGIFVTAIAGFGGVGVLVAAFRTRHELMAPEDDASRTNLSRPHRTAVAHDSEQLFEVLTETEVELRRAAMEDGWEVEWPKHAEALKLAAQSRAEKRFAKGCRDVGRAIELLMDQLPSAATRTGETKS